MTGLVALLLIGGCSEPVEVADRPSWDELRETTIEVATERGASREQIAILSGETVTFADYKSAVDRTIACLREAGIDVIGDEVTYVSGYPEVAYSYAVSAPGMSEEATDVLSQECITRNSMFVEALYRETDAVQQSIDQRFESFRDDVVECLRDAGVSARDDESRWELERKSADLLVEAGNDCMALTVPRAPGTVGDIGGNDDER